MQDETLRDGSTDATKTATSFARNESQDTYLQRICTSHVSVMAQSDCGAFIERSKTAVDRPTGQHRVFIHSPKEEEVPDTGYVLRYLIPGTC